MFIYSTLSKVRISWACTFFHKTFVLIELQLSGGGSEKSMSTVAIFHTGEFILHLHYGNLMSTPPIVGHTGMNQHAKVLPSEIRLAYKPPAVDILLANIALASSSSAATALSPVMRSSSKSANADGEAFYGWSVSGSLWIFERLYEVAFMILQTLEQILRIWPSTQPLLGKVASVSFNQ